MKLINACVLGLSFDIHFKKLLPPICYLNTQIKAYLNLIKWLFIMLLLSIKYWCTFAVSLIRFSYLSDAYMTKAYHLSVQFVCNQCFWCHLSLVCYVMSHPADSSAGLLIVINTSPVLRILPVLFLPHPFR